MSPDHDVTLSVHFAGTPHPQHRADILSAFSVMLDSVFEHSADGAFLAYNVRGAAECRLYHEKAGWIGRPAPDSQPPREEAPQCPSP